MAAGNTVIQNITPPFISTLFQPRYSPFLTPFSTSSVTPLLSYLPVIRPSKFPILNASQRPSQGGFGESEDGLVPMPATIFSFAKGLSKVVLTNLLPISLVVGAALGINRPGLGCLGHKYSLSKFITSWLFFVSGLKLQDGDLNSVVEAWPAVLYGLAFILMLSPFFSKLILKVQLVPQEFVIGLAIYSCMPTTLNGGVALTQLVGGNSALALALTITSVLLGIVTVPLWITRFFAEGFGVAIPTGKLFQSLFLTLIVPLVLGKVIRNSSPGLAKLVDENERFFSITTSILLGLFPWMQVGKSRPMLLAVKPEVFIYAIGMGILVHLILLATNAVIIRSLCTGSSSWKSVFEDKRNSRALMLVCSQRSLLIATAIVEQLGGVLGESGLLVLPCVAADVNQIVIDSLLVNFWLEKDDSRNIVKEHSN